MQFYFLTKIIIWISKSSIYIF